ncbi:hypothetical protein ACFLTH_09650 [Bacteroidota bacterium]
MNFTQLYLQYQPIITLIYLFLVSALSLVIYLKVKKLYDLSSHRGIQLFGLAFLYFSIAFFVQLIFSAVKYSGYDNLLSVNIAGILLFTYFISLPGFYIVYSLVWKHIEERCSKKMAKARIFILHLIAIIIALISLVLPKISAHLMFIPQLAVLSYGILISYQNYQASNKKNFLQMYFIAMVLWFTGYLVNYLHKFISPYYIMFAFYVQIITLCIFIIFFYGVAKATSHD